MNELELLQKELKAKSTQEVGDELGVSKATVSLVSREKYPNPKKVYEKIRDKYGDKQELIGVETTMSAVDILMEMENGDLGSSYAMHS